MIWALGAGRAASRRSSAVACWVARDHVGGRLHHSAHDITGRDDTHSTSSYNLCFYDKSDPESSRLHCSTSFLRNPRLLKSDQSVQDRIHVSTAHLLRVFTPAHPSVHPSASSPSTLRQPANPPHCPRTCHRHALPVDNIASGTVRRWLALPAPSSDAGGGDAAM